MPNAIIPKKSSVPGKAPTSSQLEIGEIAINLYDAKIYTKNASGNIIELGGGGGGGSSQHPHLVFQTLSATDITYTELGLVDTITYSSGNKKTFIYDTDDPNLLVEVIYYGTDGSTMIAKNVYTYDTDGVLTGNTWTIY